MRHLGLLGLVACSPLGEPEVWADPDDRLAARVTVGVTDRPWGGDASLCSSVLCSEALEYRTEENRRSGPPELAYHLPWLLPDLTWDLELHLWPGRHSDRRIREDGVLRTDPLPAGLEAVVDGDREATLCTRLTTEETGAAYGCVDGRGRFRSLVERPWMMRSADVRTTEDGEVFVGPLGEERRFTVGDLVGAEVAHARFDRHGALRLTEGALAGHVAALTRVEDTVGELTFGGAGIVVFDGLTGQVVWEWSAHGEAGDGVAAAGLDYDRRGEEGVPPSDWFHANALVHRWAGEDRFWISSRSQSQVYEIPVNTREIETVVGFGGDVPLSAGRWFFQQHGLEVRGSEQAPELWLFDNGNARADDPGPLWSRAVGYRLDRDAGTLTEIFAWAGPEGEGSRFSRFMGDVAFAGDELAVLWSGPSPVVEGLDLQTGEVRWTLELPGQVLAYALELPD